APSSAGTWSPRPTHLDACPSKWFHENPMREVQNARDVGTALGLESPGSCTPSSSRVLRGYLHARQVRRHARACRTHRIPDRALTIPGIPTIPGAEPKDGKKEEKKDDRTGGFGGGQGQRGNRDPNAWMDRRFDQMDANKDGFLQVEEMSENLLAEKDKWDKN